MLGWGRERGKDGELSFLDGDGGLAIAERWLGFYVLVQMAMGRPGQC